MTRAFVLAVSMGFAGLTPSAQPAVSDASVRTAIEGIVLAPDGNPVKTGSVRLRAIPGMETEAPLDHRGRFTVEPPNPGGYEVTIASPGLMSHRVRVWVRRSSTLALPPIRLAPETYFRVAVFSPAGEPVTGANILWRSHDGRGLSIQLPPGERGFAKEDTGGQSTAGPLPRGTAQLVVDVPPYARTRLPDLRVTGESAWIEGEPVRLEPGTSLIVRILDRSGTGVAGHPVWLEDPTTLSLPALPPTRTDSYGRARFERLQSGRYQIRTAASRACDPNRPLGIARGVRVPAGGHVDLPVTIDGVPLQVLLTSGGAPLPGPEVLVEADLGGLAPPRSPGDLLSLAFDSRIAQATASGGCLRTAGAGGIASFTEVPAGPMQVTVGLGDSRWVRRIRVPSRGGQVTLDIPAGVLPVHVSDEGTGEPLPHVMVSWTGGGGRVQGVTSETGDVLLHGIQEGAGTLEVEASGFETRVLKDVDPSAAVSVSLTKSSIPTLSCRVQTEAGEPVADAVMHLHPADLLEIDQFAMTDDKGKVTFGDLTPGRVRVTVRANGFESATADVGVPMPREVLITMRRRGGSR